MPYDTSTALQTESGIQLSALKQTERWRQLRLLLSYRRSGCPSTILEDLMPLNHPMRQVPADRHPKQVQSPPPLDAS